ncbi:TPA: glycosyl transferase, partial [Clostridioides difficile]|nr:glycosyl transferase [Clostridioides difficile]
FENNLYNAINSKIQSLLNNSNKKTSVDMSKKTWDGLAYRINEVILMDELCLV